MEQNEARLIISDNKTDLFEVKYKNGESKVMRLFVSTFGNICEFKKRSRTRGYAIDTYDIVSITPTTRHRISPYSMFIRNCTKAAKLLSESGLNPVLCHDMTELSKFTPLQYEKVNELYNAIDESYTFNGEEFKIEHKKAINNFLKFMNELGINWDYGHWVQLSCPKQVMAIPYGDGGYDKETKIEEVRRNIETVRSLPYDEKSVLYTSWRGSYAYSVTVWKTRTGAVKGNYSAEYKNCGNGHYFILLSPTHALFYEND